MPGRSPHAAREAFLEPLKRALSCITTAQLLARKVTSTDEVQALTLSEEPLRLRSTTMGGLYLSLAHRYRLVSESAKNWHVSTVAYDYRLDDQNKRELISWHWHPAPLRGPDFPHVHVNDHPFGRHAHVPTARVSVESILRLLLTDLQVRPRADHAGDYLAILEESERRFIEYRRWHG